MTTEEPQKVTLKISGLKVAAKDFKTPGQVEAMNPEQFVCEVTARRLLRWSLLSSEASDTYQRRCFIRIKWK